VKRPRYTPEPPVDLELVTGPRSRRRVVGRLQDVGGSTYGGVQKFVEAAFAEYVDGVEPTEDPV
jgi:hypothetical protein